MWYRLRETAPSAAELTQAAAERSATLSLLQRRLGDQLEQTETRRQLLFCHYVDAVYYAAHGAVELALAAVARGLTLVPEERDLLRLRALLLRAPERFSLRDFVQPT